MPKYAKYDTAQSAPQPVIGWRDTDLLKYGPPDANHALIEVSNAIWMARLANPSGFMVQNGAVVPKET